MRAAPIPTIAHVSRDVTKSAPVDVLRLGFKAGRQSMMISGQPFAPLTIANYGRVFILAPSLIISACLRMRSALFLFFLFTLRLRHLRFEASTFFNSSL